MASLGPGFLPYSDDEAAKDIMQHPLFGVDFSSILENAFPKPGPVLTPQKGSPVPAPGNIGKGGSATTAAQRAVDAVQQPIVDFLKSLLPTTSQKRDIAVYGLAVIVFLIAIIGILFGGGSAVVTGSRQRFRGAIIREVSGRGGRVRARAKKSQMTKKNPKLDSSGRKQMAEN